jgi:hypothetical protein
VKLAVLDELQRDRRGDGLRHRRDAEHRIKLEGPRFCNIGGRASSVGQAKFFGRQKSNKIELKHETYQLDKTGNISIEYMCNGRPSGIRPTQADLWVYEFRRGNGTALYLMLPVERLKQLCR